ncbi:MAG: hypothetical protein R6V62_00390 [Candidatus Fermentibacteraceae bacterium]
MIRITFSVLFLSAWLQAGTVPLLADTLDLSVGQYRFISFRVDEAQGREATIAGTIRITPDTARVEYILLTSDGFRRWSSGFEADTLAFLTTSSGDFQLGIPDFGDHVLLVSNRGNFHPVTVAITAELSFLGDGIRYNNLPMAFQLMLILLAGGVVAFALALAVRKLRK